MSSTSAAKTTSTSTTTSTSRPSSARRLVVAGTPTVVTLTGTRGFDEIRRIAGTKLAVLRGTAPRPEAIAVAARALQVEAARWARLRPGEELRYEWLLEVPPRIPRPREPGDRRDPRRRPGGLTLFGGALSVASENLLELNSPVGISNRPARSRQFRQSSQNLPRKA